MDSASNFLEQQFKQLEDDKVWEQLQENADMVLGKVQKRMDPFLKLMSYYKCALMEVETKFNVLNEEFSFLQERNPIDSIKTRIKSPQSIRSKLRRRGYPISVDAIENNIYDVAGIRVICPFVDDIYSLADCLLEQDDITLFEKKDYIAKPKENGYRSLHLIIETPIFLKKEKRQVKVELQFRTIAMEFWANLEHRLRYKKDIDQALANELSTELYDCAKMCEALDLKMQKIHESIDKYNER